MFHMLIMAGGGGTRFWPRSRQQKPKQFLALHGEQTLLQQAFERTGALADAGNIWIITAAQHRAETARQLPGLAADQIIGEPCGRDTAACIGLGAALMQRRDPDAVMLVMAADHVIEPAQEFRRAAHVARQMAEENPRALVTFGIPPAFPATAYGYIQRGAELAQRQALRVFRVEAFREKPDAELAEQFLASGQYFWNAGIFCWRAATILHNLRQNQPVLADGVERIAAAWDTPQRDQILQAEYERLTKTSIDYAVMEKAKEVLAVEAPFKWDDVGSWLALERMHPQDADGNTVLGEFCGVGTKNCIVASEPGKLVAAVGVDNLLIVQDGDAILVADRRDEAGIKKLVEQLKKKGLERYL